jgi:hypothetical protein
MGLFLVAIAQNRKNCYKIINLWKQQLRVFC